MTKPFTFDRVARIFFGVALMAGIVGLLMVLRDALLPFAAACLIAYVIEPMVEWNMRLTRLRGRLVPVLMTIVEVAAVVGGFLAVFLPEFITDGHRIAGLVDHYKAAGGNLDFLPASLHRFIGNNMDLEGIRDMLSRQDVDKVLARAATFFSGGLDALGGLISWAIVILYVFFILLNYPTLMRGIKNIVPPQWRHISDPVFSDVSYTMKRYFHTQALISAIVGVIYAVGFSIVGLPMGAALGLLNAVLFMVPYMVYVSVIPMTLLCIFSAVDGGVSFWGLWLKCAAVYVVAESIADLVLTPRLMGKSLNLDPAIILLSLSVWGTLLGFLGVIIALPLTTLAIAYYRQYVLNDPDGAIRPK